MASAPSEPRPVLGRLDQAGRLIAADPELEALQREAGSEPGTAAGPAADRRRRRARAQAPHPGLAARGRRVDRSRHRAVGAARRPRATRSLLSLEGWTVRAPAGPRLAAIPRRRHRGGYGRRRTTNGRPTRSCASFRCRPSSPSCSASILTDVAGQPLTRVVRLEEDDAGEMPLISALAARRGFTGQHARSRTDDSRVGRAERRSRDRRRRQLRRLPRHRRKLERRSSAGCAIARRRVRPCARRGAALAARPNHRKRRADRRARRRAAAQRLCELRQRHRRRRAAPAVGRSRR